MKLLWCTRGRSTLRLVKLLVCRRPCTERDLVSISSYVMTGNNQKACASGYKSSNRSSSPILRGKHSLSEPRKLSAFGLPMVPRSPPLACIAPISYQQHRGLNGESKLPKQKCCELSLATGEHAYIDTPELYILQSYIYASRIAVHTAILLVYCRNLIQEANGVLILQSPL